MTDAERARLRLRTIGACDVTKADRKERRRQQRRKRESRPAPGGGGDPKGRKRQPDKALGTFGL